MDSSALIVGFIGLVLVASAHSRLNKHNQRLKELEEPVKRKKQEASILARAEVVNILEKSKEKDK